MDKREVSPETRMAVVTGATKGIGRAIAEALATEGYDLAVCARSEAGLAEMAAAFSERFPATRLYPCVADMGTREGVQDFAGLVARHGAKVNVLVNNAGLFIPGPMTGEADGVLENMMETNLFGPYRLTRALLPQLEAGGDGHVFNICSVASIRASAAYGSYSITKFALLGFTRALREELKDRGVKVTAILPGATRTASWEGVDVPAHRLLPAADVARSLVGALHLGKTAVVEELLIRPMPGDL